MITYEQLTKANETIKTTPIKGKQYAEVNQRIKAFRFICPGGSISTDILSLDGGVCVIKATVSDEDGRVLGTGTAYEKEGSSNINKTSYIENCETSAIGRALGMCGIGIDISIASYEEVATAIMQQDEMVEKSDPVKEAKMRAKVLGYINRHGYTNDQIAAICKRYKVEKLQDMNIEMCRHYISYIESKGGSIDE